MPNKESSMFQIHEVGALELDLIIEFYSPLGKYWTEVTPGRYVAVDNTTGNAWTEEFNEKELAIDWLNKKFEKGEEHAWKVLKLLERT